MPGTLGAGSDVFRRARAGGPARPACHDGGMNEPGRTGQLFGSPFVCRACGYDRFLRHEIKMQTTGMTFFDLGWLNRSADGVICERCGYVHMFAADVHRWDD